MALNLWTACALFLTAFNLFAQVNLTNGLVAHYDFNGNANDVSGNNYHGTVVGATLANDRLGSPNQAYFFNGNAHIFVPHTPDMSFGSGNFSISFWMQTTFTGKQMIMQKGGDLGPNGAQYWIRDNETTAPTIRFLTGNGFVPSTAVVASSSSLHDGNWHHIAAVRRDMELEFYFNGCLVATISGTKKDTDSFTQLIIGAQNDWGGKGVHNYFNGYLDEIRLYDRVLTNEEILVLAEAQSLTSVDAGVDFETCNQDEVLDAEPPPSGIGTWTVIQGQAAITDQNDPKSSVQNLSSGVNSFQWLITNGCETLLDTVDITKHDQVTTVDAGVDLQVCNNDQIRLNAQPAAVGTGTWSVVQGTATFVDSADPQTQATGLSQGTNVLKWTVSTSCNSMEDNVDVEVGNNINQPLGSQVSICPGETAVLDATIPGATYLWSTGSTDPTINVDNIGNYWVDITLTGCETRDSVQVVYGRQCDQASLVFHNAVNPKSTIAENQSFYLHNPNAVQSLEIFIFDRWGEMIFHSKDKFFKWSGLYKGQLSPTGLYTYRVIYNFSESQVEMFETFGSIYLVY